MTEEEKVKEIVDKYLKIEISMFGCRDDSNPLISGNMFLQSAKECAKIEVNQILNLNCVWYDKEFAESKGMDLSCTKEFWQSVFKKIDWVVIMNKGYDKPEDFPFQESYKIIFPKEETLEEAAEIYANSFGYNEETLQQQLAAEYGFIAGAKYQQEKMYSEDDLKDFGAFVRIEDRKEKRLFLIQDYFELWVKKLKIKNETRNRRSRNINKQAN